MKKYMSVSHFTLFKIQTYTKIQQIHILILMFKCKSVLVYRLGAGN